MAPVTSVLSRLLSAYRRQGYLIRTGLNPFYMNDADAPFTRLIKEGGLPVSVGAGLAFQEILCLETLFESGVRPARILIVGNAFGWSAIALGLMNPEAVIVALDAGVEGEATSLGTDLTRRIARAEGLNIRVVDALSPRDVSRVVSTEFGHMPIDFVLLDGFHSNAQLRRDFDAASAFGSTACVYLCHDVMHWHMVSAFRELSIPSTHERRLLTRTPSGMGIVFPRTLASEARDAIDVFCDPTLDLDGLHEALGVSVRGVGQLLPRLAHGWRFQRVGAAAILELEGREAEARAELDAATAEGEDDAETQMTIGAHHIDRGRAADAEPALRRACALAPTWELPAHLLGRVLQQLGRYREARLCLEQASALRPEWAPPQHELGVVIKLLDGDRAALAYFDRAIALQPEWAPSLYEAGRIRFELGEDAQAIEQLRRAALLDSAWSAPRHLLGLLDQRSGDLRAASRWLESAVNLEPSSASIQFDLGIVRQALGDEEAAVRCFDAAGRLAPDWASPQLQLGVIRFHRHEDLLALIDLHRVIAQAPNEPLAHHVIGLITARGTGPSEAIVWFERAISRAPAWSDPYYELGACWRDLGDDRAADASFAKVIELAPAFGEGWREAGRCAFRLKEWRDSADRLGRAADLGCMDAECWRELAVSAITAGARSRALQALQALTAITQANPSTFSLLKDIGIWQRALGQLNESKRTLSEATAGKPEWAGAHFELGRTCCALDQTDQAEHAFQVATRLRPEWIEARDALATLRQGRRLAS